MRKRGGAAGGRDGAVGGVKQRDGGHKVAEGEVGGGGGEVQVKGDGVVLVCLCGAVGELQLGCGMVLVVAIGGGLLVFLAVQLWKKFIGGWRKLGGHKRVLQM